MRLKKIEITGFKSFADKTTLEFHEGITAIVGPNGCGKSNTADAFRWVLGEQSAKSLRGGKMHDVIFAGASQRKPLNMAEVTLTLTDNRGELPIDYHEVSVTRRLFRNGESVYLINGNPVRLKDVQNLFLGSGVGKNSFSMFEQGKLDQVINYSPQERRFIFDSAADIGPFLQRKAEALKKLQQSEGNITRIKDIHLEVEKQITVLQEQAEKARIFKENKAKLESFEKMVLLMRWDTLEAKLESHKKKEQGHKEHWEIQVKEASLLHDKYKEAKVALEQEEKVFQSRKEEVYKTQSEKEIKSQEMRSNEERLRDLLEKEKKWKRELEAIIEKRQFHQAESESLHKQLSTLDAEQKDWEKKREAQLQKVHSMDEILRKKREECQEKQRELLRLIQQENQYESDLKQNRLRLETNVERSEQLQERKTKLSQTIEQYAEQAAMRKKEVEEYSDAIDRQRELFNALENQLQELVQEIEKGQRHLSELEKEMAEGNARQKVLQRMREDLEGFSAGSKKLLQESANVKSSLHKKIQALYERIEAHPEPAKAFAAVMRPYAQTLVVESRKDLSEVMTFILKHQLKDVSLLCLESISTTLPNHFFADLKVCDTTESAMQLLLEKQAIQILTEEESFVDHRKVIFFGFHKENNPFAREAELKTLEKKLQELEKSLKLQEEQLAELSAKKSKLQVERMELDKGIRKDEMKLMESNFSLQRLLGDLEKTKSERAQVEADLRHLKQAHEELIVLTEGLETKLKIARTQVQSNQGTIAALSEQVEKESQQLKQEQNEFQSTEAQFRQVVDESRKVNHALHVLEVKNKEGHEQQARLEEELEISQEQQAQFEQKGAEYGVLIKTVEANLEKVVEACSELEQKVATKKMRLEQMESQMAQLNQQLKEQEKAFYQLETQAAQTQAQRENIREELLERYHLTVEEARSQVTQKENSLEQAEKTLRGLRQEIESAGDINLTSIEEYSKYQARYQFLNEQIDDLEVSKTELREIIEQLDGESRKIFKEVFEKIRANFQKNFQILFVGGEADLQFTDTDDVLEAGIEIIAKPPGKQMRSINLLSGGEKCLTAVALLFAIFEVKSAPFCILDEIDAPLDDSNVERFVNVVKEFVDRCQFIIITHNKRTMAIADRLFGVSMEEKGVSKLLSIEFSQAENHEMDIVSV
ncbi:AAA family ATPase [Parachlamydia sp. AcF125]|uniref:AAA family ATPase n=1 Tax=Parachlamydia sp. AcF125 TaxID=2795736 RepID=UPI001BC9D383|nr:AAA family ATPase [Parachlamydia sp. AcF125]MBS4167979.1 Chromosome partition protein Smc [Parachlamydia sp. AcF125]